MKIFSCRRKKIPGNWTLNLTRSISLRLVRVMWHCRMCQVVCTFEIMPANYSLFYKSVSKWFIEKDNFTQYCLSKYVRLKKNIFFYFLHCKILTRVKKLDTFNSMFYEIIKIFQNNFNIFLSCVGNGIELLLNLIYTEVQFIFLHNSLYVTHQSFSSWNKCLQKTFSCYLGQ